MYISKLIYLTGYATVLKKIEWYKCFSEVILKSLSIQNKSLSPHFLSDAAMWYNYTTSLGIRGEVEDTVPEAATFCFCLDCSMTSQISYWISSFGSFSSVIFDTWIFHGSSSAYFCHCHKDVR